MSVFIPNENVEANKNYGQTVNKIYSDFIKPELRKRGNNQFRAILVEIFSNGEYKTYLNDEVQTIIEFKSRRFNPKDSGKNIQIDIKEIKDVKLSIGNLNKSSAKILLIRFNKDWWILKTDYKNQKTLDEKYKPVLTFKVRGGGYLPLNFRKKERNEFFKMWEEAQKKELPGMWKRYITISQRYRGTMVYDGNYFDLFLHAQELYVLGYYYTAIIVCRTATEQALVSILINKGHMFEIYKQERGNTKLKSIEQLVSTCRSYGLFKGKYPLNKIAARKINEISTQASNLVHPKQNLDELNKYQSTAIKCLDNLYYTIRNHLNFIKDTGVIKNYRPAGTATRLR